MNEPNDRASLTPAEEDPVIHRELAALSPFAPTVLFEERVLTRVWRPEPEWARNLRSAVRELRDTGRIWLVLGALALGSLIPAAVLAGLGAAFASEIGVGVSWLFEQGLPTAATAAGRDLAAAWSQIETQIGTTQLSGGEFTALGAGSAILLAGCAIGLVRAMRPSMVRR
jgi:hypothetical protein